MKKKSNVGKFFTPKTTISGVIILIAVFMAVFSDVIAPYDPTAVDPTASFLPVFSPGHILGTDKLGRDLLSRLIVGAQSSMLNALLIVLFEVVIGVPIGLICGYYGGKIDAIIMRLWDVVCAMPSLLLSFVLIAVFGRGNFTGVMAIGIAFIPLTAKMARSLIITEKKAVYVEACRSMGYSDMRIIFSHILPNVITTMIAQFTMDVGSAIVSMATLSYLGLGIQPPDADWGTLLENGMQNFYNNSILLAAPAIAIMLVTVAVNILSDGIQEYIDPSQRKLPTFKQYERKLLRAQLPERITNRSGEKKYEQG